MMIFTEIFLVTDLWSSQYARLGVRYSKGQSKFCLQFQKNIYIYWYERIETIFLLSSYAQNLYNRKIAQK